MFERSTPLDKDEKITYSDLSKKPKIYKEKPPVIEPAENLIPSEEQGIILF